MDEVFLPEVSDVLLAYLQRSVEPSDPTRFRQLVGIQGRLGGISTACFLLHCPPDRTAPCVHRLLYDVGPLLLPQLSRTTERQRVVQRNQARGRIDWPSTYKARYSEDANPNLFVSLECGRRFDRPENQLLKFLLHHIQLGLLRMPHGLRLWRAWGKALASDGRVVREQRTEVGPTRHPSSLDPGFQDPLALGEYFAGLAHRARTLSAHVYLRNVALPAVIEGHHLLAARSSKNGLYAHVAGVYELYHSVVQTPDWQQWSNTISQTLPLPAGAAEVARLLVQ